MCLLQKSALTKGWVVYHAKDIAQKIKQDPISKGSKPAVPQSQDFQLPLSRAKKHDKLQY